MELYAEPWYGTVEKLANYQARNGEWRSHIIWGLYYCNTILWRSYNRVRWFSSMVFTSLSPVAIIYYAFDWKWRVGVCRRVVNWFVLKKHTLHLWSTEIRDKKRKHKHIWRMWSISSRETWTFNWLPQSPQSYRKIFFLPSYPYYQRSVRAVASFQKTCSSCLSNLSVTNSPSVASYTLQRGD